MTLALILAFNLSCCSSEVMKCCSGQHLNAWRDLRRWGFEDIRSRINSCFINRNCRQLMWSTFEICACFASMDHYKTWSTNFVKNVTKYYTFKNMWRHTEEQCTNSLKCLMDAQIVNQNHFKSNTLIIVPTSINRWVSVVVGTSKERNGTKCYDTSIISHRHIFKPTLNYFTGILCFSWCLRFKRNIHTP